MVREEVWPEETNERQITGHSDAPRCGSGTVERLSRLLRHSLLVLLLGCAEQEIPYSGTCIWPGAARFARAWNIVTPLLWPVSPP
jgi:hypothetical protein